MYILYLLAYAFIYQYFYAICSVLVRDLPNSVFASKPLDWILVGKLTNPGLAGQQLLNG